MYIIFDLAFLLYSLVYFPYLICTNRWYSGYGQRFGFFPHAMKSLLSQGPNVWVHAVSVGEVQAVEGLVRAIKKQKPDLRIVCTATTKAGYELAQTKLGNIACVLASPLDFSLTVRAFIRLIRPQLYIATETEIWPNLFHFLHQRNVPIAIINGRISDRSYGRYQNIQVLLKEILNKVSVFAMQSEEDARRIISLGADKARVFSVGNIKFDDGSAGTGDTARGKNFGIDNAHPIWIAGSTHPGEERIALDVFKRLKVDFPLWRLVLAPRHIERSGEVAELVAATGFKCVQFSNAKELRQNADTVVVVDTIGHLRDLYAQASLVFVGKSLCVGGGHNIIEPALFAKPIIIGPMMENFRDIVACFKAGDAVEQVADAAAFERAVKELMGDESRRKILGERARAVIERNQGALGRTMLLMQSWL